MDSFGNVCGTKSGVNSSEAPDLKHRKKLLFLDPFDFLELSTNSFATAKKVCVETCPTGADQVRAT